MDHSIKVITDGRCHIIISRDPSEDFPKGAWHLSISTPNALPSYAEMKEARYKYIPDNVYMAEIFPPKSEFVNLHPYVRHLWQIDIDKTTYQDEQYPEDNRSK